MKLTYVMAGVLTAALGAATPALAQAAPAAAAAPAGPLKIGTLNFQYCVLASNEGQRDFGELQKKYAPRKATLDAQATEIANMQKALQNTGANLSDDERAKRVHEIEVKQKDYQRGAEDLQKEGQEEEQQVFERIAKKVADYINEYSAQYGYSLILENGAQSSPIVYENPAIDITKAIVTGYNTKSGVAAPPASATAPSAAPRRTTPARPATK